MRTHPSVAVVILNWNGITFLQKFLPSVLQSRYPGLRIIMGDNASGDDSVAFVQQHYPQVEVIKNDRNYGFSEGYNRVLKQVQSDYYVLLNSDVEVTENWISPVIELMEQDPLIAACQPKIKSFIQKDHFEYAGAAGGFIDRFGYAFCRGRIFHHLEKDEGQYNTSGEIFWASGAALFIRTELFHEAGGLDPHFFAHMEEIDLCWRLKNRGYKIVYCADAEVYHVGGGTLAAESPRKVFLNFRNNLIMLQKNLPGIKAFWVIFMRFFLDLLAWLRFLSEGKFSHAWAVNKAHAVFLWKQPCWIRNRKKELSYLRRPDYEGYYKGSIVLDFFLKKKKRFSDLGL